MVRGNARKDFRTLSGVIVQTSNDTASHDLRVTCENEIEREDALSRTVDAMAAGTFAMIDITGLRFLSINTFNHYSAP